jgi:hypothetical protein
MRLQNNPPYILYNLLRWHTDKGWGVDNYITPLYSLAYPLPLKYWGPLPPYPPSYMTHCQAEKGGQSPLLSVYYKKQNMDLKIFLGKIPVNP